MHGCSNRSRSIVIWKSDENTPQIIYRFFIQFFINYAVMTTRQSSNQKLLLHILNVYTVTFVTFHFSYTSARAGNMAAFAGYTYSVVPDGDAAFSVKILGRVVQRMIKLINPGLAQILISVLQLFSEVFCLYFLSFCFDFN